MDGGLNKFIGVMLFCILVFGFYGAPSYALPESVRALRREVFRTTDERKLYDELAPICEAEDTDVQKIFSDVPADKRRGACLCMVDQGVTDLAKGDLRERRWDAFDLVGYVTENAEKCEHPI